MAMVRQRLLYYAALLSLSISICANAAESTPSTPTDTSAKAKEDFAIVPSGTSVSRSKEGVEALIEKEGSTPPGWWEEVKLNVPPDLDLTWSNPTANNQNQNKFLSM